MEEKFSVKTCVKFYADNATVHGITAFYNSPTRRVKFFILLLMAILFPFMVKSIFTTVSSFFMYKVFTSVQKLYFNEMPFPSVTICRNNMLSKSQIPVSTLNRSETELLQLMKSNMSFVRLHEFTKNISLTLLADLENMNVSVPKIPDMILPHLHDACIFSSSIRCNLTRDFKPTFSPSSIQCYTFQYDSKPIYFQRGNGHSFGLQLIMFFNQSDTLPLLGTHSGAGFSVFIHPGGTLPLLGSKNIFVATGFNTLIGIRKKETILKEHPYPSSCSYGEKIRNYFPGPYSAENCRMSCVLDAINTRCGYADPVIRMRLGQTSYPNITFEMLKCRDEYLQEVLRQGKMNSCYCPTACNGETFDYTVSQARWPTEADLPFFKYYVQNAMGHNSTVITDEFIEKNILKVTIYYEELSVQQYVENAVLDEWALISGIGGHLGFWCGASVFSALEFIAFLCSVSFAWVHSRKRSKQNSVGKIENEGVDEDCV